MKTWIIVRIIKTIYDLSIPIIPKLRQKNKDNIAEINNRVNIITEILFLNLDFCFRLMIYISPLMSNLIQVLESKKRGYIFLFWIRSFRVRRYLIGAYIVYIQYPLTSGYTISTYKYFLKKNR